MSQYVTIKDSKYVNNHSVNPLYLIIGEADGSIEQKNRNKDLTFATTDQNKEVLKKYTEFWNNIKSEYEKDYMMIKFNSDDNLPKAL